MMTIKEFASLCNCNTQTLRYYDKIGLLKPVKVDQWSGYRYYAKSQAIDFVKIKNLQAADFTIKEIETLLTMTEQQVWEAFELKIAEQTQKLERIQKIQQSYLTEINTMKKMIHSFCNHLLERANAPEMLREFNMDACEAATMVDAIRTLLLTKTAESGEEPRTVKMVVEDKLFEGERAIENMTFLIQEEELNDTVYLNADHLREETSDLTENTELLWESSGWTRTHEFLDDIPAFHDDKECILLIRHYEKLICGNLTYPMLLLGKLYEKGYEVDKLHCFVEDNGDGKNSVSLLRKK